jgi:tetratricopeptide (TPR) repeat protein
MPQPRYDWIAALAIAGITLAAFAPSIGYGFVSYDDREYVTYNPHVQAGIDADGIVWAFGFHNANWHPLTWLSLELDATLWKSPSGELSPIGFHLGNVLLHAANAALVFLVFRALTGAFWRSVATALLFALHPLRVESVAWVAERKDVLSIFFGLLGLIAYWRYTRLRSVGRFSVAGLALACSLMAKPTLVTFPFLLLVLDWWPLRRLRSANDLRPLTVEKIPLFVLVGISSVLTFLAQLSGGATRGLETYSIAVRLENAFVSYVVYLEKTIWPAALAPFYPHAGDSLPILWAALSAMLLVALTVGTLWLRSRAPYLVCGWLWFLGTLVPVIGLVQVGNQAYADRYTYFAQIGLWMAVCWGFADLAPNRPRVLIAAAAAAIVTLLVRTEVQLPVWRNSFALWQHALEVTPRNPTSLVSMGTVEEDRGHPERAEEYYREAIGLVSESSLGHMNLGKLLARQGRRAEAAKEFQHVCDLTPRDADAWTNLGKVLYMQGKLDEAAEHHRKAIDLAPDLSEPYYNLALVQMASKEFRKAAESLYEALRRRSVYPEAHLLLGQALEKCGDVSGAAAAFAEAVRFDPHQGQAWYGLGMARIRQGMPADAEACLSRAMQEDPAAVRYRVALAVVLDGLAGLQASGGNSADAVGTERRALDLLTGTDQSDLAGKIEENMHRYQRGDISRPGPTQSRPVDVHPNRK